MNYKEYAESIKEIETPSGLVFTEAFMWWHREMLPLALVSLGNTEKKIIKVPGHAVNSYGNRVPVITIKPGAFRDNKKITDIILPPTIRHLPSEAFSGCSNLRNIVLPRALKRIEKGTFDGCVGLENIYYEGTPEEWKQIEIVHSEHEIEFGSTVPGTPVREIVSEKYTHIPGNEPVFIADIHFRCDLGETCKGNFVISVKGNVRGRIVFL